MEDVYISNIHKKSGLRQVQWKNLECQDVFCTFLDSWLEVWGEVKAATTTWPHPMGVLLSTKFFDVALIFEEKIIVPNGDQMNLIGDFISTMWLESLGVSP